MQGELFRGLTDEEKAPYEAKAKKDKIRYEKEMADYQASKSKKADVEDGVDEDMDDEDDDDDDDDGDEDWANKNV